jgi:hypothetical protein
MSANDRSRQKLGVGSNIDELFLQPWFLPRALSEKIRSLLPSSQFQKMRYYFDDYGCLRCGKRDCLYGANGMCESCCVVIRKRIATSLFRRFRRIGTKLDRKPLDRYLRDLSPHDASNSPRKG